jgi:hypothetical protein
MASAELRMATNFFMVSLLGFFHRSTSAAEEKRAGTKFIPNKSVQFQIFRGNFMAKERMPPGRMLRVV